MTELNGGFIVLFIIGLVVCTFVAYMIKGRPADKGTAQATTQKEKPADKGTAQATTQKEKPADKETAQAIALKKTCR